MLSLEILMAEKADGKTLLQVKGLRLQSAARMSHMRN
jgi:hypothetical protein